MSNVFTYGPDGKVFFAAINFPGSWADGSLCACFLYSICQRICPYKIRVDQGFPHSGDAWNILVGPMNECSARQFHPAMSDYMLCLSNVFMSLRQSSEWGMCALQSSFPQCKKYFPSDFRQRRLVLESIILIHNFRTDIVGSNQTKTVLILSMRDTSILMGIIVVASIICNQRTLTLIVTIVKTIFSDNNY
jgi:hypothetical protein